MRTRFLTLIISFIVLCIGVSSCLNDDQVYEYSSDASVHAFGLDTINGVHYHFHIDQIERRIFNPDSLPYGSDTLLDAILIDTFSVTGYITSGTRDTILNLEDSLDLRPAINGQGGIQFKIHASDVLTNRVYTLDIRVHQEDPDSLMWQQVSGTPAFSAGQVKAVTLDDQLLVYTPDNVYRTSISGTGPYTWQQQAANLPAGAKLNSLLPVADSLYLTTDAGQLFRTADGLTWTESTVLSGNIVTLIAALPGNGTNQASTRLAAIRTGDDNNPYYCVADLKAQTWTQGEMVEEGGNFPTENISSTHATTANGIHQTYVVGMPQSTEGHTAPWLSADGMGWGELSTSSTFYCPALYNPFIMYYGDTYYITGHPFEAIYSSNTGIVWQPVERKFLLPEAFSTKGTNYSATVDKNNFIWFVWGSEDGSEVWRGCLNRLKPKN